MTQQIINVGTAPNTGTGDPARTGFQKTNDNFTELYARPVGGTPGGVDTQMQFNNANAFGGASMTYNATDKSYSIPATTVADNATLVVNAGDTNIYGAIGVSIVGQTTGYGLAILDLRSDPAQTSAFQIAVVDAVGYKFNIIDTSNNGFVTFFGYTNGASLDINDGLTQTQILTSNLVVNSPPGGSVITIIPNVFTSLPTPEGGMRTSIVDSPIPMIGNFGVPVTFGGGGYTVPLFSDGVGWFIG
jgi:hypothetical protein